MIAKKKKPTCLLLYKTYLYTSFRIIFSNSIAQRNRDKPITVFLEFCILIQDHIIIDTPPLLSGNLEVAKSDMGGHNTISDRNWRSSSLVAIILSPRFIFKRYLYSFHSTNVFELYS